MIDIERAKLNPSSIFISPQKVTEEESLTTDEKIEILRRWEYDAREMQVATEENMPGTNSDILSKVLEELNKLGAKSKVKSTSPTKTG